jgi:hypothetical protein
MTPTRAFGSTPAPVTSFGKTSLRKEINDEKAIQKDC